MNKILHLYLFLICQVFFSDAQLEFLSALDGTLNTIKSYSRNYLPSMLADTVETLGEAFISSVGKKCVYRCPDGSKPKLNQFYKPIGNGCGVDKLNLDPKFVPIKKVTRCCDEHDICYGTCNKEMDKCDEKFKKCLDNSCSLLKDIVTQEIYEGCKMASSIIYTAVNRLGCKYYKDAQKQACLCTSHDEL